MANIITFPKGNVGIGTETPNRTLEIAGTLRLTGSTGTGETLMGRNNLGDVSAITIGSGLSLSENTLTSTGGGGGGISGTGTTNYVPKWNSSTSLADSIIFQSGTSVGIGTTSMDSDGLDIKGTSASEGGRLGVELATTGTTSGDWTGTSFAGGYTHTAGNTTAITTTLAAVVNNIYQVSYTISGGTTGTVNISFGGNTSENVSTSGTLPIIRVTGTTALTVTPISTFNRTVIISVKQVTGSVTPTFLLKNSNDLIVFEQRAPASPTNIFQGKLSGQFNINSTGNTFYGNAAGQYITTGHDNSFYGFSAGNLTTIGSGNSYYGSGAGSSNATGSNNTAIGSSAGASLKTNSNTVVGSQCASNVSVTTSGLTAIGYQAAQNQSGVDSVMVGYQTGNSITGDNNVLIGYLSHSQSASNSSNSVSIGHSSSRYMLNANNNVAIGFQAAATTSTGNTTSLSNSILIGYSTKNNTNGETGAVVIGHQAISLGSNTTVLGKSSTTRSKIWGSIENQGAGATNATTSLLIQNSASTPKLTVKDGGAIEIGSNATVTGTTTAAIQVVDSSNANVGLALAPKGSGAFTLLIPDNTITGGNSRGVKAVDLQMSLSSASSIASGNFAFIGGGSGNTASGVGSTIAGGTNNTITNSYSSINGGNGNTVNSTYSTIIGGSNNLIPSTYNYSSIIGGRDNGVYALYSIASGYNASAYLYGQSAKASGFFTTQGDAQTTEIILRQTIIGTGSTELFLDGVTLQSFLAYGGTTNRLWTFTIQVAAFVSSGGTVNCPNASSWSSVHNGGIKLSGTTTTLLGVSLVNSYSDSSMSTAIVTIAANDTTDALTIFFKPPTTAISTTVTRVVATIYLTEVGF
jgi:hypothetical protein